MVTEYSVRSENTGVPIILEVMVATTLDSLFAALFHFASLQLNSEHFDSLHRY
jgi:hypothetical protein